LIHLSAESETRIRENYLKLSEVAVTIDDVWFYGYYGTYNGYEVVGLRAFPPPDPFRATGAGNMTYSVAHFNFGVVTMYLHKDGTFVDLNYAFMQELINEENLYHIHYYFHEQLELIRQLGR